MASIAPRKSVPLSDLISITGPRKEMKRRRAFTNDDALISFNISIWMALEVKQVNSVAHLLLCAKPPPVLRADTVQGPKTPHPLKKMEAQASNGLQVIHSCADMLVCLVVSYKLRELTSLLYPTTQNPLNLTLPSVISLPWWYTFSCESPLAKGWQHVIFQVRW